MGRKEKNSIEKRNRDMEEEKKHKKLKSQRREKKDADGMRRQQEKNQTILIVKYEIVLQKGRY